MSRSGSGGGIENRSGSGSGRGRASAGGRKLGSGQRGRGLTDASLVVDFMVRTTPSQTLRTHLKNLTRPQTFPIPDVAKVSVVAYGGEDESETNLFNGLKSQLTVVIQSGAFGDELNAIANEQGVSNQFYSCQNTRFWWPPISPTSKRNFVSRSSQSLKNQHPPRS